MRYHKMFKTWEIDIYNNTKRSWSKPKLIKLKYHKWGSTRGYHFICGYFSLWIAKYMCDECQDTGITQILVDKDVETENGPEAIQYYTEDSCQECCEHGEYDHGICGLCGADCLDDLAGAAEAYYEGDR